MIGNITMARNMNELQTLIQSKYTFMNNYIELCKSKGATIEKPHKTKIVVINDTNSCGDEYIVGSILLPNSRAMFHLIEGHTNDFVYEYYNKLMYDSEIQEYIAVLLAGLLERGFDYIFYFDNEDDSICLPICNALSNYLYTTYGVVCYNAIDVISNNLYMNQSIVPEAVTNIQNIINNYKLSNRPTQLFMQY